MNRWHTFTFRVSQEERQAIGNLALQLQRSQSDAVRFVVIEAERQLNQLNTKSSYALANANGSKQGRDDAEPQSY